MTVTDMSGFQSDLEAVRDLIRDTMPENGRSIISIAGPPASGKSTLAEAVVDALNHSAQAGRAPTAALVPMDGYHLDNAVLRHKGLLGRKGAPETFDAEGFCHAVHRLTDTGTEHFFPRFDRTADQSIAGAIAVHPQTPVVVVEGNYLLLNTAPWSHLRDAFTACVFVSPSRDQLRDRLVQRWIDHGLDPEAALNRALGNDLPNAARTLDQSTHADLVLGQNSSS